MRALRGPVFLAVGIVALSLVLAGCEPDEDTEADAPDAPAEPVCANVDELTASAGYTLYEGINCPANDPITEAELAFDQDDLAGEYVLPWDFEFMGESYSVITPTTNGSIFFSEDSGDLNDFELELATGDRVLDGSATGGSGIPRIQVWNLDLSSFECGPTNGTATCEGVRVQAKTDPDRVILDWDTEVYDEAGTGLINHVAVILFPTGEILFWYDSFQTVTPDDDCPGSAHCTATYGDFGSGITRATGSQSDLVNLTDAVEQAVWELPGSTYLYYPDSLNE